MGKYKEWADLKVDEIKKIRMVGGLGMSAIVNADTDAPPVDAGLFDYARWTPDTAYAINQLFVYPDETGEDQVGFCRNAFTSSAVYPPFSPGTESLYGIRPRQLPDGTYPYKYNMKAEAGMRVRSGGKVYLCYNPIDPVINDPSVLPAHFTEEV